VNSAMSLPKATEEEKLRRKAAVQNALADAAEVPLKGMQLAARALGTLAGLAPRCNKHLVSDLSGAVHFLQAALTGCGENVSVNASALHDATRREGLVKEHARIVTEGQTLRESILKDIQKPAAK